MAGARISGQIKLNSRDERQLDDKHEVRGVVRQKLIQDMLFRIASNNEGVDSTSRQIMAQAAMY